MKLKNLLALTIIVSVSAIFIAQNSAAPAGPIPVISPEKTKLVLAIPASPVASETNEQKTSAQPGSANAPTSKAIANQLVQNETIALRNALIGSTVITNDGEQVLVRAYKPAAVPNDSLSGQWWESFTGVNQVWDMPVPQKQTLIAVIDTGLALNHQEFSGRLFENPGEMGAAVTQNPSVLNCTARGLAISASCNLVDDNVDGIVDNETGATTYQNPSRLNCADRGITLNKNCDNIDNDANGLIDDVTGWDFINYDNKPLAGELNATGSGTQHGTMVAGIAAANGNNTNGIAGVDWYAKILPIQAIDDDGYGNTFSVASAIRYAADMGADVINLSLGSDYPDSYLLAAIEYAVDKNVVVVAAAGNTSCNCMIYPATYDATLSVGALNQQGAIASFSSYGAALDVMAPGVSITSSSYTSANQVSAYATGSGTSFAAPLVSGLISRLKGQLPTATVTQLTALVTEQTKEITQGQTTKSVTTGFGTAQFGQSSSRSTTAISPAGVYAFGTVTNGGLFSTTGRQTLAYACEGSKVGTTTLFKLKSASKTLYTLSEIDKRKASLSGYAVSSAFSACILQPHDTPQAMRVLNTPLEFDNVFTKASGL